MSSREKKFVPRFRRRNEHLIDADDQEAQALIEKDLESHFHWTSDLTQHSNDQFHHLDHQDQNHFQSEISQNDQINERFNYDIENNNNNNQQLWKIEIEEEKTTIIWDDQQQQQKQIKFSIDGKENIQQWSFNDNKQQLIQFNINETNDQHHFDTNDQNKEQTFIQGEQFRDQMKFAIESSDEESKMFVGDSEDLQRISIDSNLPSRDLILSLPQRPIIIRWLEGISNYRLSFPGEPTSDQYSPLNENHFQIDAKNLRTLKWSIDLLKENLLRSYLISLPNYFPTQQYSLPEQFHFNLSINQEYHEQIFSSIDSNLKQTLSISTNDIKEQLLSIIDSIKIKQNFGNDETFIQWSLEELKIVVLNISPIEIFELLYSPTDVKQIEWENLFIPSDDGNARTLRRYRCKHMSIKHQENSQLDCQQHSQLQFNGTSGEEQIQNDLQEQQQTFQDEKLFICDNQIQCYDILMTESSPINVGPCLYRSDYECDPPKTWSNLRREIGSISFDGSLKDPIYYLNKSYKKYLHIPKDREKCSFNVYQGYQQFIQQIQINPDNYFRSFDSIDLRHLLYWYEKKQYLFSSTNSDLLKPPNFICRRTVLRTILANLYSDSEPWKLLVMRIKGQFYLALANKASKKAEEMTEDEYSGYAFEKLFTTDQPNTTRFKQDLPLKNPQQGFHTVQYWQFGQFNILYSNEIDAEILPDQLPKNETTDNNLKTDDSIKETETENIKVDWLEGIIPPEQISDPSKEKDLPDEKVEKKKSPLKSGYVEMKCTNKKIFYRDEHKFHTLHWWAQMWLANINTLMIGYKTSNSGTIEQLDLFSIEQMISKFFSSYNLYLKYCFSYLHSFLQLIEKTVFIDDPNTIHQFSYIPQPLEIDPITGKSLQVDLPRCVPFRYTQIKRSNQRHHNFMPLHYLNQIQRTIQQDQQIKTIQEETKKRLGHRGRSTSILKQIKTKKKS